MKKKILSIILVALIPLLLLCGCGTKPDNKIDMKRYFPSCSYVLSGDSVTGNVNSYIENKHASMNKYSSLTLNGDTNWLYGMTLEYITFEIYSNKAGEFEIEMQLTNLTKGSNELEQDPDKVLIETFSGTVKERSAKQVKININDVVKSIKADTKLTFIFHVTPDTTYTIQSIQLYGYHK